MEKADELFGEISTFSADDPLMSEPGGKDPEDDGLPYESLEDFSTDPVEFAEMSERMLQKVGNLFDLTAVYNRHSAKYLKACTFLEKGIKFLGSACITKSAMEREKISFPELGQLSTEKLYRMASFNYRKLDAALTEKLRQGNDLYPELLDMEFRYFNLLRRLRSTETKIHNYHDHLNFGSLNCDPVREGTAFSANSWAKYETKKREEAPAFRNAPAFPLILSEGTGVQRSEQKSAADSSRTEKCVASDAQNQGKNKKQYAENGKKDPGAGSSEQGSGELSAKPRSEFSLPNSMKKTSRSSSFISYPDKIIPRSDPVDPNSPKTGIPLRSKFPDEPPEKFFERMIRQFEQNLRTDSAGSSGTGPAEGADTG